MHKHLPDNSEFISGNDEEFNEVSHAEAFASGAHKAFHPKLLNVNYLLMKRVVVINLRRQVFVYKMNNWKTFKIAIMHFSAAMHSTYATSVSDGAL